ncbi:acetyl-CoA carboxylase biotin carboxylase subunit, partial [Pseudomonas aeruginosa]|nr:acetyl-CoA carboxylase biotin carboxylase subunit [Pseudomonas aeruginosa]
MNPDYRSIQRILVANRGEIACRVMRSARALGIGSVAVHSDIDRHARHVAEADIAVDLGGAKPADSYLRGDRIIAAALASGAQAIHPGYGFLSENADFARACEEAGLLFLGPPAAAIDAMGSKSAAKALMEEAGVPLVPGYHGEAQDLETFRREAGRIGYPVLLKAAAGGGGKGMKVVEREAELAEALSSAQREAKAAFGDARMLVEKYLLKPRHVEIQVFADSHGHCLYLNERDCSIQRRHQKVVEEAPAPGLGAELRRAMGEAAVRAAQAIGYVGAGTVEFLLDERGQFFFMEMNTRLQVEHPVTEAITGLDLVAWQIRVARGEALPLTQEQVPLNGHAIEVRLCAEDPQQNFLPQSGTVARWRAPGDVRTDHALADGLVVSPYYDSMLAKIVAHGTDRADACRRLAHALDDCLLLGLPTNRAFLRDCLAHPAFLAGDVSTAFIDRHFPAATRQAPVPDAAVCQAAAVVITYLRQDAARRYPAELHGWASSRTYPTLCRFTLDGEVIDMRVRALGAQQWEVTW